jgi:hypothetical protein
VLGYGVAQRVMISLQEAAAVLSAAANRPTTSDALIVLCKSASNQ